MSNTITDININGIELSRKWDGDLIERLSNMGLNVAATDDHTGIVEALQEYANDLARISVDEHEGNTYLGNLDYEERKGIWKASGCYPSFTVEPIVADNIAAVLRGLIASGHGDVPVIIWPELSDDDLNRGNLTHGTVAEALARIAP